MAPSLPFINLMHILIMQGPKVSIGSQIRSGLNIVEIKIVNQDEELHQKTNQL